MNPELVEPCYVVLRVEADGTGVVKLVVWSEDAADLEVARLNRLNRSKGCRYQWELSRAKRRESVPTSPHALGTRVYVHRATEVLLDWVQELTGLKGEALREEIRRRVKEPQFFKDFSGRPCVQYLRSQWTKKAAWADLKGRAPVVPDWRPMHGAEAWGWWQPVTGGGSPTETSSPRTSRPRRRGGPNG